MPLGLIASSTVDAFTGNVRLCDADYGEFCIRNVSKFSMISHAISNMFIIYIFLRLHVEMFL